MPCVINRLTRPKSGYGGKWDPSKWWGCCTKRDQQKTSCVSVCLCCKSDGTVSHVFVTLAITIIIPARILLRNYSCCSPLCYSTDFDDDDEGNKLFRYFCTWFCHKTNWGVVWSVLAVETSSNVFSVLHQVRWWIGRSQQWQRALCQVGRWTGWNRRVDGILGQHCFWHFTHPPAALPVFFIYLVLLPLSSLVVIIFGPVF